MIFILRHVEKDVFLPREALENRRDVNPVAFLKKALASPPQQLERKKSSMLWQWSQQLNTRKEIKRLIFDVDWSTNPTRPLKKQSIKHVSD